MRRRKYFITSSSTASDINWGGGNTSFVLPVDVRSVFEPLYGQGLQLLLSGLQLGLGKTEFAAMGMGGGGWR